MADTGDWKKIVAGISDEQVLKLEQAAIRIPSTTFEEGALADHLANRMSDIGLDVEMMEVTHWAKPGKTTRQPIARLRGTGGGPSLMLNGHMDPGVEMSGWSVDPYGAKFEDGWVWGMGAHDDKGGVVAAICAVEAIVRSGVRLRGDVVVCPVVAHKLGGAGTRALMKKGVRTDLAINMEHSANTIANVCVGIVMVRIKTKSPELFFRYSQEAKAQYMNPIEQQAEIMRRVGPSLDPIRPGGWLRFTPHPDLPGFPTHTFDTMHKEHYYQKSYTGMSSRECEMIFQLRTVPGQTLETVQRHGGRVVPGSDGGEAGSSSGDVARRGPAARHRRAGRGRWLGTPRQRRGRQHPHVPRHPHRAIRCGRHPDLQRVADAGRACAAPGPRHRRESNRLRDAPALRVRRRP